MPKDIKYWNEARMAMFDGIEQVAKTVTVTMWPKWRNVVFDRGFGAPQVTNDGATIAKEVELEDRFENMGAELIKQAAERTNTLAGDGTTTATLLTYALAKEWLENINSGVNAVELKNGMKAACKLVVSELEKNSTLISSKAEVAQVASISAQDDLVWDIIADAMEKVWNDGVISVEEWHTFDMEVEITEWMQFEQWYISPYMVSNTDKMIAEMKDAPILIVDSKISNVKDFLPVLESIVNTGKKDLVIIAEDIDGEALTAIILNKLKWVLNILGVKAPGFWDKKKDMLKDLSILTGATVISQDLWMKLENASIDHLWMAKWVVSTQAHTTIVGWAWSAQDILSRVEELKLQYQNSESKYDKEKLSERIAKLAGWVAVIKVWAASEVEMKEKKLRIEDALNATRAAVSEWVVAGWWIALLRASKVLEWISLESEDQNIWASIVKLALSYPLKQIVTNSWRDENLVIKEVLSSDDVNYGYDALREEFTDMIEVWIIDPKKVERIALQEAVSLAGMFLTTESAIADIPGKNDLPPVPQMGGMWGMPGMWMM